MDKLSPEVKALVLDAFATGDLLRFSRTNRANKVLVRSYMDSRISLSRFLGKFFPGIQSDEFILLLQQTDILVIGLSVFHLLNRTQDNSRRLDLVVNDDDVALVMGWLADADYKLDLPLSDNSDGSDVGSSANEDDEEEEEAFINNTEQSVADDGESIANDGESVVDGSDVCSSEVEPVVSGVIEFVKYDPLKRVEFFIRLFVAKNAPLEVVLASHTTCAFNFISSTGIYSLYPDSTFDNQRGLAINNDIHDLPLLSAQPFEDLGFSTVSSLPELERCDRNSDFYSGETRSDGRDYLNIRFVGDKRCWRIPGGLDCKYVPSWFLVYKEDTAYTVYAGIRSSSSKGVVL